MKKELLIFVGYSKDADAEAGCIRDLEKELQGRLDTYNSVSERDTAYDRIKIFTWKDDARPGIGGQEYAIAPFLDKAAIAVFIFKSRIGSGAWVELDSLRARQSNERIPVLTLFPATPPQSVISGLGNKEIALAWSDLVVKKESLTAGWLERDSRAVTPCEDYRDAAHLQDLLRTKLDKLLVSIITSKKAAQSKGRLTQPKSNSPSPMSENINRYLKKMISLHETISLSGFETKVRVPIHLEDLYVPLDAMVDRTIHHKKVVGNFSEMESLLDGKEDSTVALDDAFDLANRCGQRRGIVIIGDPGAGKTTHLRRLILGVCQHGATNFGLPEEIVPVLLPLRNLGDGKLDLCAFMRNQFSESLITISDDFTESLIENSRLLLLFDGLDEVAGVRARAKVAQWIDRLLRSEPEWRIAVTCRYAGYQASSRLSPNFLELHMRPMSAQQSETFIHNWFRIVETSMAKDKEKARYEAAKQAEKLITRLRKPDFCASRVFELTRNPLLLTTICLVHRDRGVLPRHRARLYDESVNVLLERWRQAKALKVNIQADVAKRVLQPVAYWLHNKEGRTRATAKELSPVIESALHTVKESKRSAEEFLRSIRDESGLLTGWSTDLYGFMHLGFQEYLAARDIRSRAFANPDALQEIADHFGESWWREVILLLLALEDTPVFDRFMRAVMELPVFAEQGALLEECFEDAVEISYEPFIDLLKKPPGDDRELWKRQAIALRIVEGRAPDELGNLVSSLSKHPFPEISGRFVKRETQGNVITIDRGKYELVLVPGGEFWMGSVTSEKGRMEREGPRHKVGIPGFYMGQYPVTNEQYGQFLKENSEVQEPRYWADRRFNQPRQPVVGVSWKDAKRYAEWAGLRLPSEAEWEFACRAGTSTRFYTGDQDKDLERAGWYYKNSDDQTHPVGEKEANAFGLYDMHGNVWEWVEDDWHGNYKEAPGNEKAWIDSPRGDGRVFRGGSWNVGADYCRSAVRSYWVPDNRFNGLGFRLARSVTLDP